MLFYYISTRLRFNFSTDRGTDGLEIDRYGFGRYFKIDTDIDFKETDNRSLIPIISILPIQPIPIFFGDRYRYILISPITYTKTATDIKQITDIHIGPIPILIFIVLLNMVIYTFYFLNTPYKLEMS